MKQVFEIFDYAYDNGISTLDTADAYGDAVYIIGEYNKKQSDKYSVNTKFKSDELSIEQQIDISLKSLNVNQIETMFFHSFDDFKNYPDYLTCLINIKEKGKINKIGLSVYDNNELTTAINTDDIDVIQLPFNLLDNYSQRGELLKRAKEKKKEIQVRSIFLQGLFFMNHDAVPDLLSSLKKYLKTLNYLCLEYKVSMAQLAMQYTLQQEEIDLVLIGVDNLDQLKQNIKIASKSIPAELIDKVDEINVTEINLLYPKSWS